MEARDLDQLCVNTIRFLAVDMIQNANSGHPGMPLGAAPVAYTLWSRHLRHDPTDPNWPDRDRFVLSGGHASALLYSLLHLFGYDLPLEELKAFRQWGSRTPGHPEFGLTPGVEATTGPLGQGISNAVGMAIGEAHLAARYNRPGHEIVDHYTYVLASDGDLMEGVASEACSLAGHLRLGKLIVIYDSNRVTLAGATDLDFSEDVEARFRAYGWHTQYVADGNDLDAIDAAITAAKAETNRPSLIRVRTVIGYGAPHKQGTYKVHGAPLGEDELRATKEALGWPTEPMFHIPDEAREHFSSLKERGKELRVEWETNLERYQQAYPSLAAEFTRRMQGDLPENWERNLPEFSSDPKGLATRKASEAVLQALAASVPELVGGSADLNPSTYTWLKGEGDFEPPDAPHADVQGAVGGEWGYSGRNIHFGVREHAMGAIANGLAYHGGFIPYTATFTVFSDYMRPPIRIAAMSKLHTVFVFTHDSIGVGEDGPTHQPVEQVMSLRLIPNLTVIRPADANEVRVAWEVAIADSSGPTVLVFTRQRVPTLDRSDLSPAEGLKKGGYVLWESGDPQVILIGTGSEVHVALAAGRKLAGEGIGVRVVSLPSFELFERQPPDYRDSVLPPQVTARVAVEAGATLGWTRYVGTAGVVVGVDRFGASAPGPVVMEKFGITPEHVAAVAKRLLSGR